MATIKADTDTDEKIAEALNEHVKEAFHDCDLYRHRLDHEAILKQKKDLEERNKKILDSAIGYGLTTVLSILGVIIWEYIRTHAK